MSSFQEISKIAISFPNLGQSFSELLFLIVDAFSNLTTPFRRCSFNTEFHRYHIIKYTNTYETHPTYLDDLFKIFRQQNVPESSLDFIKKQMSEARTIHTTITTEARRFLEDRLTKSPFLMEFIIRMFYYDYVMFGFDMPEIYKSR